MNESDFVSSKEAAKIVGQTHGTLNTWRRENRRVKNGKKPNPDLKHVKIGGKVFYFKSCLLEFIRRNTLGSE